MITKKFDRAISKLRSKHSAIFVSTVNDLVYFIDVDESASKILTLLSTIDEYEQVFSEELDYNIICVISEHVICLVRK